MSEDPAGTGTGARAPWDLGSPPPQPPGQYRPGPYAYPQPPGPYPPLRPGGVARGPGLAQPVAFEAIPQTPFAVAVVGIAPTVSGPATASLIAGAGSILVALVVGCFGALGSEQGWGPMVAGAFAVLAGLAGLAALLLGRAGLRQVRRNAGWRAVSGRGLAIAGIICGTCGVAFTAAGFVLAVALTAGA